MILPGQTIYDYTTWSSVIFISAEDDDNLASVYDPDSNEAIWVGTSSLDIIFDVLGDGSIKPFLGSYVTPHSEVSTSLFKDKAKEVANYLEKIDTKIKKGILILKD